MATVWLLRRVGSDKGCSLFLNCRGQPVPLNARNAFSGTGFSREEACVNTLNSAA
jgi:hypothetical protein